MLALVVMGGSTGTYGVDDCYGQLDHEMLAVVNHQSVDGTS